MSGYNGLSAVELKSADGASAIVTLQGAQVVSWIPAGGEEQLFVSARNSFAPGHPIRGGVPVVFPQFSKRGTLPQHGFARNRFWKVLAQSIDGAQAHATFSLESSEETLRIWPHPFVAELSVGVGAKHIEVELTVRNTGQQAFSFTTALHTYLAVSDARRARLEGLSGDRFEEAGITATDTNPFVGGEGPVDRIYFSTPTQTRLVDGARVVSISQRGFSDTVVWNPGREIAIADMAPDGYLRMLCVEAAAIESPIALRSSESWSGAQRLEQVW